MTPRARILIEAAMLAVLGMTVGLVVNHRLVADAFAGRLAAPVPAVDTTASLLPVCCSQRATPFSSSCSGSSSS